MKNAELEDVPSFNTFAHSGTQMARDPTVWRYMDLISLLTLLHDARLHFSLLSDLQKDDPNEGTGGLLTTVVNFPISPSIQAFPSNSEFDRKNKEEVERIEAQLKVPLSERMPEFVRKVAEWDLANRNVHVSCWHTSEIESDFMWKVYAKREFGLAIVSTAHSVVQALQSDQIAASKIGWAFMVYPTADQRIRNGFERTGSATAFIVKSPEFRHENEFRVFVKTVRDTAACNLPADLKKLIHAIRLSPFLPDWAEEPLLKTINPICEAKGIPIIAGRKPKLRGHS